MNIIDGQGVALKGSAARDIKEDRVQSKLCEAAWIQDVRGSVQRAEAAKNQIRMYLGEVDRIYQLRVIPKDSSNWIYQLVEIPSCSSLQLIFTDKNLFAPDGPRIEVTDSHGLCMGFILDRSDSKITIGRIPIERCVIHGRWSLVKREAPVKID